MPKLTLDTPTATPYPNLFEFDPEKKDKKYITQYGQAHVAAALITANDGTQQHFFGGRHRYLQNALYARGKQGASRYKRFKPKSESGMVNPDGSPLQSEYNRPGLGAGGGDVKAGERDHRILQVVPKFLRSVVGLLDDDNYDLRVDAVDPQAQQHRAEFEAHLKVVVKHRMALASLGIPANPPEGYQGDPPENNDEVDMYMLLGYQFAQAMMLEMKLTMAFYDSNWKQIQRDATQNDVIMGSSALFAGFVGRQQLPMNLDPGRVLALPSRYEDYHDITSCAHIETISLGQLRSEAGKEFTDEQYREMAGLVKFPGSGNNTTTLYSGLAADDPVREQGGLDIIRFTFKSWNRSVKKGKRNAAGNYGLWPKKAGYSLPESEKGSAEVHELMYEDLYQGTLLLGTDYSYGCKRAVEQPRDEAKPTRVHFPYVLFTPDLVLGQATSMTEMIEPIADFAQREWMMLQDSLSRAVPKGYAYDLDALENMVLTKGGKAMTAAQIIEGHERTGRWLFRSKSISGERKESIGIHDLPNGLSTDVQTRINNISWALQMLEGVTAANSVVTAASPNAEIGKGVSELAIKGAQNAFRYLSHAKASRHERIGQIMASRIVLWEKATPAVGSVPNGAGMMRPVGPAPEIADHVFRLMIRKLPTQEEKVEFDQNAQGALNNGQITLADMAMLKMVDNLTMRWWMLAVRSRRNQKDKLAQDQQQAQLNAQAAAAGPTATGQAAVAKVQAEWEARTKFMERQEQLQYTTMERGKQWDYTIAKLGVHGAIEKQAIAGNDALLAQEAAARLDPTNPMPLAGVSMATPPMPLPPEMMPQQEAAPTGPPPEGMPPEGDPMAGGGPPEEMEQEPPGLPEGEESQMMEQQQMA